MRYPAAWSRRRKLSPAEVFARRPKFLPIPPTVDGKSFVPLLKDPNRKLRDGMVYAYRHFQRALRTTRWKYIRYTEEQPPLEQLFDLQTDPQEERDLASAPAHTKTLSTLRARCDSYRKTLQ